MLALERLEGFGVDLHSLGDLLRQLERFIPQLGPKLGGKNDGVDREGGDLQLLAPAVRVV